MITGTKVGILGGGQLGMMLVRHAIDYGLDISVLDKNPDAPSSRYTKFFTCGDPADFDDVLSFGRGLDVLTVEMEQVNTKALRILANDGVKVYPSPDVIETIQDKLVQKNFLAANNIPVVPGISISGRAELHQYLDKLPGCLKKRTSGYDGYGVMILRDASDIAEGFDEPSVLEELVEIAHEISVIVSRNVSGDIACYDPVMMMFNTERLVLDFQLSPADISKEMAAEAQSLAVRIAEAMEFVGILAVELFVTKDGKIIVNELAPRPHNSGHHTIEGCTTSQYEQQLRAILDLPLGEARTEMGTVMINILEPASNHYNRMNDAIRELLRLNAVHLHWYGKKPGRQGRKIGHITITGQSMEDALSTASEARKILNNINE